MLFNALFNVCCGLHLRQVRARLESSIVKIKRNGKTVEADPGRVAGS
jgi:hypothetical protein